MGQSELNHRLIHTKSGAVFALCSSGYVTALVFRNVLSHPQHKSQWLFESHFILPTWVEAGVNLVFYACLVWGSAFLYRIAQGKERVLVGCWVTTFLLGLIQNLVSTSAAAAIEYLKALAMVVAFFAAVDIFLRMPAGGYPQLDNQPSRNS
jgi:hypothetical protein